MTDKQVDSAVSAGPKWGSGGSIIQGWPATLTAIILLMSALYAFSPRDFPDKAPTEVQSDLIITNALAVQGNRYIGAGELGHILIADAPEGPWRPATLNTENRAMITDMKFVAPEVVVAVGHSGWILRSGDSGETWNEVQFNRDSADPLLTIDGPFEGAADRKIFALGSFGQYLTSKDEGRSWTKGSLNVVEAEAEAPADDGGMPDLWGDDEGSEDDLWGDDDDYDPFASDDDDDYDPFAAFGSGGGTSLLATSHMYAVDQASDGSLFLVGERGLLVRSTDGGESWTELDSIYNGSLYGVQPLGDNSLLVYGMRGNAFVTRDLGETWRQSFVPVVQGLYGSAVGEAGEIILAGASNTLLISIDGGLNFQQVAERGPNAVVRLEPLGGSSWITAGEGGLSVREISLPRVGANDVQAATGGRS